MTTSGFWTTFVASGVFSGLIATTVTLYFQSWAAARQRRLDCLRRVAACRSVSVKEAWLEALNEICITFNGSPAVIEALTRFERDIRSTGGHKNELLADLIKAMMDDLKLDRTKIDDEFLLRPFGSSKVQ